LSGYSKARTQSRERRGCGLVLRASPYPLIPACAPELVGFLPPSRLAQRDAAKACDLANLLGNSRSLIPSLQREPPGAGAETTACIHLADVPRLAGAGRFEGTRTTNNNPRILRHRGNFLNKNRMISHT